MRPECTRSVGDQAPGRTASERSRPNHADSPVRWLVRRSSGGGGSLGEDGSPRQLSKALLRKQRSSAFVGEADSFPYSKANGHMS